MNLFEKYIANCKENKEISKIIDDLCLLNLTHSADTLQNIFGHTFIKFVKWEIIPENEYDFPDKITMYYIGKDNESGEEKEYSKRFEWKNLLIKIDGYE